MKIGFGKKKKKSKKQKHDEAKQQPADGDDVMQDAGAAAAPVAARRHSTPEPVAAAMEEEGGLTAKEKQRSRMELKKALKVQVAQLKSKRNKLTKLAANKTERRQLNSTLREMIMQEELLVKGKGGSTGSRRGTQQKAAQQEPLAQGHAMAE